MAEVPLLAEQLKVIAFLETYKFPSLVPSDLKDLYRKPSPSAHEQCG